MFCSLTRRSSRVRTINTLLKLVLHGPGLGSIEKNTLELAIQAPEGSAIAFVPDVVKLVVTGFLQSCSLHVLVLEVSNIGPKVPEVTDLFELCPCLYFFPISVTVVVR